MAFATQLTVFRRNWAFMFSFRLVDERAMPFAVIASIDLVAIVNEMHQNILFWIESYREQHLSGHFSTFSFVFRLV